MTMANVEKHLKIPFHIKRCIGESDTLEALYAPPQEYRCYVEETSKSIIDEFGKETVSNTQFYISGTVDVDYKDVMLFEGREYRIKSLDVIRNKKGTKVLKVVYV
jgi:hypothetical protein